MEPVKYYRKKNNETRLNKNGNVSYFSFTALDRFDEIVNAFSTREGGVSTGFLSSMNLGLNNNDSTDNVKTNYGLFCRAININPENIVISEQKHTSNIKTVTEEDRGKGLFKARDYSAVDGLVTNKANVALCLLFADCVPVYLYDPVKKTIALVHSGWKGTLLQIAAKAVSVMKSDFNADEKDIVAVIGPSICRDCYEVSRELYNEFSAKYTDDEMKKIFIPGKDAEHFQLGLWKAIEITLIKNNICPENIHITDVCTCCNAKLMFSHRFTNGKRGNSAAVLMLKNM